MDNSKTKEGFTHTTNRIAHFETEDFFILHYLILVAFNINEVTLI